jgi:hypothetical protein
MVLDGDISLMQGCLGGPVIDTYGSMMGIIVAHYPKVAIMCTTTVKTCIDMCGKFRFPFTFIFIYHHQVIFHK